MEAGKVDLVLSSPPYCTRIDYAKSTAFELAVLGIRNECFRSIRDQLMGTTTIRREQELVMLPSSVETLLSRIGQHPSHRSAGYYMRNARQYFSDAHRALGEIARVLCPGGRAVLVLQNSYYKEIPIELSQFYCDMAQTHGLNARVVAQQRVGRTMASMNTRARAYRRHREYSEDVVLMEKRDGER